MTTTNNPRDRVPPELIEVANIMKVNCDNNRQKAYKKIAQLMKMQIGFFGSNKKGNFMDQVALGVVFLVFVIFIAVVITGTQEANTLIQAHEPSATVREGMQTKTSGLASWMDFGFVFFFFLIIIVTLAVNLFVQENLLGIIIYFCTFLFGNLWIIAVHNGLNYLIDKMPATFAALPLTTFVINAYAPLMLFFYIVFFILIFARPRGEGASL